jgi:hypothetical protein
MLSQVRLKSARRAIAIATGLLAAWAAGPAIATPNLIVHGGGIRSASDPEVDIWANSPTAALSLQNPAGGFHRTSLRWFNVPAGAFLASPQGVAEGATRHGGSLLARVLVSGHSGASWQLDPNLKGSYSFAISGGDLSGLALARRAGTTNFAIHLGNSGLAVPELLRTLEASPFPVYVVPGNRDSTREFVARTGEVRREFTVAHDHFLILDNADRHVGKIQREWLALRLRAAHQAGARRVFVFMHWPVVDPRRAGRSRMASRQEIRQLETVLREGRVTAVFTGHAPIATQVERHGVNYYVVGPGHALVVQSQGDSLSIRMLP